MSLQKTPRLARSLYFHVKGHSSVNALHMHIVDEDCVGPTFEFLRYKNLRAQDVLAQLQNELRELQEQDFPDYQNLVSEAKAPSPRCHAGKCKIL